MTDQQSHPATTPRAERSEVLELVAWATVGLAVVIVLVALGTRSASDAAGALAVSFVLLGLGLGLAVLVGIREQRDMHRETRERLDRLEAALTRDRSAD